MRLKSYFSGTVEAAMELAQKELGEDALLINARPSTPETRALGAYEVVFGVPPKSEEKPAESKTALLNAPARSAATDTLAQDVADLKREIERMSQSFRGAGMFVAQPTGSALYNMLIDNELHPTLARQVADGARLEDLFEVDPTPGRRGATRGVVALVGPPGVGKTTTLAKLAARFGLTSRKPAYILSADVYRIAAAEQMRSLASILGIGFDIVRRLWRWRNRSKSIAERTGCSSTRRAWPLEKWKMERTWRNCWPLIRRSIRTWCCQRP